MAPEFSRPLALGRLGGGGFDQEIEASCAERLALAARLQIPAIASLRCRFTLRAPVRGQVAAEGLLRAEVTQLCVVSLEPFEAAIQERFALRFVPEGLETDDVDPETPDEVTYRDGAIDLGEAAAVQLALSLAPYPRMPGVAAPSLAEATEPSGQFASLRRWRAGPDPDEG